MELLNHDVMNSNADTRPEDKEVLIRATVHDAVISCSRRNLECIDECPDVWLFEPDYTLAASTGFLLWPGTWVLLRHLNKSLGDFFHGKKVIELGSGIGLAGLGAAAAGAHCLLTDLPSVVAGVLDGNIRRNEHTNDQLSLSVFGAVKGSSIGSRGGSASCLPIDWTESLEQQLSKGGLDLSSPLADIILAVDVVWLRELLEPFRSTCAELLRRCQPGTPLLLTYIDRSSGKKEGSVPGQFSSRDEVAEFFRGGGMIVESFLKEKIEVDRQICDAEVFKITLQ